MERVQTLFKAAANERGYYRIMVNDQDTFDHFTGDGWVQHVDQLTKPEPKSDTMSDEERLLRDEYELLTGKKIGGRAKMGTIKQMLAEAKEE